MIRKTLQNVEKVLLDNQVIDIYREQGHQGVIDWYTRGVDALITSGDLSEQVEEIIYSDELVKEEKIDEVSMLIGMASVKKLDNETKY